MLVLVIEKNETYLNMLKMLNTYIINFIYY